MSPIKGISEVVRFPRLGKIRLGIRFEGPDERTHPIPTDYFVCPDEVKKVFGDKPKELRIMFPTEDREQWASQYLRCYSESGSLLCRGDGERALAKEESVGETGSTGRSISKLVEMPCYPLSCLSFQHGYCRKVMNLQFLIPECPGFGVYQLDTSSFYSMKNINSMLTLIENVCQRVSMIPLSLHLIEQPVRPGSFLTTRALKLTCQFSLAEAQRFVLIPKNRVLLPPPDSEAPDDVYPNIGRAVPPPAEDVSETSETKDDLPQLWLKAKSKVYHYEIQDYQIADWFWKNLHINVRLKDFERLTPPFGLTAEVLSKFCNEIDRHAG